MGRAGIYCYDASALPGLISQERNRKCEESAVSIHYTSSFYFTLSQRPKMAENKDAEIKLG
jgi:hypothetical protein